MKKAFARLFVFLVVFSILFQFAAPPLPGKAENKTKVENLQSLSPEETDHRYHRESFFDGRYPYLISDEREHIPPTPEVIAETKAQVSAFDCATVTDVPEIECKALVAFYESTNGAGWTHRTNWLETTRVGIWNGVWIEDGVIVILSLGGNNLSGSIPSDLGNLFNLRSLSLSENQLSGSIPAELGNLSNLEWLNLSVNQLSGNIPSELGNLSGLEILFLVDNQLTGNIPSTLGKLSNLSSINLSGNQLSGSIPEELGDLTNLDYLILHSNQLSGDIPIELGNLSILMYLDLSKNQLSGSIPIEFGNLSILEYLDLSINQLSGNIPTELNNLSILGFLYLSENQLTGNIPEDLGKLTRLERLCLDNNQLTGSIPAELGQLANLRYLFLNKNFFEGDLPNTFINLVNLCEKFDRLNFCGLSDKGLDLGYNRLNVPAQEPVASFLKRKDPDWYLTQTVKVTIPGESGGTFQSNDGKTVIEIPAGAYPGEMNFLFIPHSSPGHPYDDLTDANNSFELIASTKGATLSNFNLPLKITIDYTHQQIGPILENSLKLYNWKSEQSAWNDAILACPGGEYIHNTKENWLSLPLCELGEFALLGEFGFPSGSQNFYLPLVWR
ncbi:MAG: hypothetical protein KBA03_00010 [Anaerolineaceae bacterium]|nr:hypothetical protein [Anaerolineaceae bacterium]